MDLEKSGLTKVTYCISRIKRPLFLASEQSVSYSMEDPFSIYPLTTFKGRYGGTYEGGQWLAFPLYPKDIAEEAYGDDIQCLKFFDKISKEKIIYGYGDSPTEAVKYLHAKLIALSNSSNTKVGYYWTKI